MLLRPRSRTCKETGKRTFKSAGQARRSALERGMCPCRVYRCEHCRGLHITSRNVLREDIEHVRVI